MNLAAIGQLELLEHLFGRIQVPEAVYIELVIVGQGRPGAHEVETWPWFDRQAVADTALVARLEHELDRGEAEAIALAIERGADLLLIDERRGRAVARRHGVAVLGLLGVLVAAKQQGHLTKVKPVLDSLIVTARFRVGDELYANVLESVGEA